MTKQYAKRDFVVAITELRDNSGLSGVVTEQEMLDILSLVADLPYCVCSIPDEDKDRMSSLINGAAIHLEQHQLQRARELED
jgi:hypothetical protein